MTSSNYPPAVGLSIGCTTLAAVTADRAVTIRPAVIRGGGTLDGFVDRVGDPVGIIAADGSMHPAATLLAEALLDLARNAIAGGPLPVTVGLAYPGHWRPAEVEALRRALRRIPPWVSSATPTLLADYAAALRSVRPGMPDRGVVAVCDFGGSATTVTLVDLATERPIGARRHTDFCGDAIDRALLTYVLASAGLAPGGTGTAAIAALTRLRSECRAGKERLSVQAVTVVPGRAAGLRGDVRITRAELEELIRTPLAAIPALVQELLRDNNIAQLAAVVSVGGGAAVPALTTALSAHLRVPVIVADRPALASARGAALAVSTGEDVTAVVPVGPRRAPAPVAWSLADLPEFVPQQAERVRPPVSAAPRPRLDFAPAPDSAGTAATRWHRHPMVVAAATLAIIAAAGGATALALHGEPAAAPRTVVAVPAGLPAASAQQQSDHHTDQQHGREQQPHR